jgi:hypothetical protein
VIESGPVKRRAGQLSDDKTGEKVGVDGRGASCDDPEQMRLESTEEGVKMAESDARVRHHPVLGDLPDAPVVHLTVDGREITARAGEMIAAALLANDIHVFRTTPHSGEPRGPFCAVGRCPDCMMTVDGVLNVLTCQTPVRNGMRVETQQGLGTWEGSEA